MKKGRWHNLGRDLNTALKNYANLIAMPENGMAALIDKAMPFIIANKSISTVRSYQYYAKTLKEVFAEFTPDQITHAHIVRMMDAWSNNRPTANYILSLLSLIFQWALDRDLAKYNPCISVKRFPTKKRDRLITKEEYKRIYSKVPNWLQVIMDLCYLTGQRIGDVLKIEISHLLDEGIFFRQQKTNKRLIVAWTPALLDAVARARSLNNQSRYLIAKADGSPRKYEYVWKVFKAASRAVHVDNVTLHDLRAMAGTHAEKEGKDPTALLGHSDRKTTQSYLRDKSVKVVFGTEGLPRVLDTN